VVERSYFGSGLWISADLKDVTQRWWAPRPFRAQIMPQSLPLCRCPPLFERPLGKPVADAVKGADGVYRRAFASGTKVTFDTKTNNGTIVWGNGAVAH